MGDRRDDGNVSWAEAGLGLLALSSFGIGLVWVFLIVIQRLQEWVIS